MIFVRYFPAIRRERTRPPLNARSCARESLPPSIELLLFGGALNLSFRFLWLCLGCAAWFHRKSAAAARSIIAQAARHAPPAIYPIRDYVVAGGLMSYALRLAEAYR